MEKHHTKKFHHHTKYYVLGIVGFLGLVLISMFIAYNTYSNDPVSRFFKNIYPASIVGGRSISLLAHDQAQAVAQALDPSASGDLVMDNLVKTSREQQLLTSLGVTITPDDVISEMEFFKADKENQYIELVSKYFGGNVELFTDLVIIPRVYDTLLRTKYNSDFSLNGAAYTEAQDIIKKIQEGAKFEDVALNSDDKITGQLGGDLGFVTPKQVIPELGNLLADLKSGEVAGTAVASRYGYHVLYLSEVAEKDGQKQYHLKHILVTTLGYEQWLDQQLKKIPVRRIK